jgi:tRNA 2-selenouridine synthase
VVGAWVEKVRAGQTREVVLALLRLHYDPTYAASIARNFIRYSEAQICQPANRSPQAMSLAASELVSASPLG